MTELLGMAFFQRAVAAAALAGAACAVMGVWIVLLRIAFLGLLISHAAFAGALFGLLAGAPVLPCSVAFALVAAAAIGPLSDRSRLGPDTALGILFSLSLGLAFVFMGLLPDSRAAALNLLWGNVLTLSPGDLGTLAAAAAAVLAAAVLFSKEIHAVVFNRELAAAAGIPATPVYYGILLLCGVATAACLKTAGGLLVASLIVNPAAAACRLSGRLRTVYCLSAAFGVLSALGGLFVSAAFDLPAGACIVLASSAVFLCAAAVPGRGSDGR